MKLLSISELKPVKGISFSRAHLYRKIGDGTFPQPVRLGPNRIGFVEAEVDEWLRGKVAERDGKQAA